MKVCIVTFGCKVNQYESEAISELLTSAGYNMVNATADADIVLFNSCAVTDMSVKKLRKAINSAKKNNKIVAVMGCVPQVFEKVKGNNFMDVDIFLSNSVKDNIVNILDEFIKKREKIFDIYKPREKILKFSVSEFSNRTRAFLKIEDGCNRFCSYCIIPYARGRVLSKPIFDIVAEARKLAINGYKEIILVGINLSSYGIDSGERLYDVVEKISAIEGIERIRLGSLEPDLVDDEFLSKLSKNVKFCPQFHLSLQSGSNNILNSMRRLYTREEYINIVKKIRNIFKYATITTDLIVGFPGETDADFQKSIDIIRDVGFLKVHVFPYSVREGTIAAKMENQVSSVIKSTRVKMAMACAKDQSIRVMQDFLGHSLPVLYERKLQDNMYEGYTTNYIPVLAKSSIDIRGKIVNTLLNKIYDNHCVGILDGIY